MRISQLLANGKVCQPRARTLREALAREFVATLRGQAVFGDAHNGLFLAAPRRTGNSACLQADRKPALEKSAVTRGGHALVAPAPRRFAASARRRQRHSTRDLLSSGVLGLDGGVVDLVPAADVAVSLRRRHLSPRNSLRSRLARDSLCRTGLGFHGNQSTGTVPRNNRSTRRPESRPVRDTPSSPPPRGGPLSVSAKIDQEPHEPDRPSPLRPTPARAPPGLRGVFSLRRLLVRRLLPAPGGAAALDERHRG